MSNWFEIDCKLVWNSFKIDTKMLANLNQIDLKLFSNQFKSQFKSIQNQSKIQSKFFNLFYIFHYNIWICINWNFIKAEHKGGLFEF